MAPNLSSSSVFLPSTYVFSLPRCASMLSRVFGLTSSSPFLITCTVTLIWSTSI